MTDHSRNFITEKRAQGFIEDLKAQGITEVELWTGRDGFGQQEFTVKWNDKEA